jgi:hypothetical protein
MSDGREEREQQEQRRRENTRDENQKRFDRLDPYAPDGVFDETEPERVDS